MGAMACAPLLLPDGSIMGVLQVSRAAGRGPFSPFDLAILADAARAVGARRAALDLALTDARALAARQQDAFGAARLIVSSASQECSALRTLLMSLKAAAHEADASSSSANKPSHVTTPAGHFTSPAHVATPSGASGGRNAKNNFMSPERSNVTSPAPGATPTAGGVASPDATPAAARRPLHGQLHDSRDAGFDHQFDHQSGGASYTGGGGILGSGAGLQTTNASPPQKHEAAGHEASRGYEAPRYLPTGHEPAVAPGGAIDSRDSKGSDSNDGQQARGGAQWGGGQEVAGVWVADGMEIPGMDEPYEQSRPSLAMFDYDAVRSPSLALSRTLSLARSRSLSLTLTLSLSLSLSLARAPSLSPTRCAPVVCLLFFVTLSHTHSLSLSLSLSLSVTLSSPETSDPKAHEH
ncbi:hypothetical protein T484DRAFT_3071866 [Baffinella frigidus]|nr:hypothetical protein T484DRAFT_3071866 [Cryptophyta sp. CCMP2293]